MAMAVACQKFWLRDRSFRESLLKDARDAAMQLLAAGLEQRLIRHLRCARPVRTTPDLTLLPGVCLIPGPTSKPRPAQRICSPQALATRGCSRRDPWIGCTTRPRAVSINGG